jgi:hypothetical protein
MISYKLYFSSIYRPPAEAYVMLDAVLEPAPYAGVRRRIACGELYRSEQEVELPSLSGLLADKLLCIGPSTLGIPLGKHKEAHRLKHVFDVAHLARQAFDPAELQTALAACMRQEAAIQRREVGRADVIADTRRFVSEPLAHEQPPSPDAVPAATYLGEIVRGFPEFRQGLFHADYAWGDLQRDCRSVLDVLDGL